MIELARVIRDLREELEQAIVSGEGEALRFELGTIELELSVAVERAGHAEAKVRFWVVESGANTTASRTSTQLIKMALQPILAGSRHPVLVSGRAGENEQ
ncbi:hypothetical protein OG709_25100 [Streptomyces sp. NBC_01267]|uniref:trypco2 family protein n=1 Tax=unclassified Streptomyces TaxID=2593676 RepID=UPI002E33DF10|nr:trypco2 family protein [Streptomyces sp. NBC_01267]WSV53868.1 hypothetical protein OG282_09150 [Streptomyces sp. NBC_01014]